MPKDCSAKMWVYLHDTVYMAAPSNDLTTLLTRRIAELTQADVTARLKAIIVSAGTTN